MEGKTPAGNTIPDNQRNKSRMKLVRDLDIVCFGEGYYGMAFRGLYGKIVLRPLNLTSNIGKGVGMMRDLTEDMKINSIYRKITKK